MFIKNLRYMCLIGVIALGLITIVGSNPTGDSDTSTTNYDTTAPEDDTFLSNSDFSVQSGLADGGIARTETQTMTGTVPNPTGSSDTYGGKAYLVLNSENIPLDITKSVGGSGWSFTVTFSVNAGPNTICIEVYDLNDVFVAATAVWNIIGTIEPTSEENIYNVLLDDPDLTAFPTVELTVGVADSNTNPVEELTSANFYVANAGTSMSPVTVTDNGNGSYTLKYTDITSGRRDLYVYVYVPAEGDTPIKGGLSSTKTYGTNYALLVGLNEYPEAAMNNGEASWVEAPDPADDYVLVTPYYTPGEVDDFTLIFKDTEGGTDRDDATVYPTSMTPEEGYTYTYRLDFDKPANYNDYDRLTVMYKKTNWLSNCINDIDDLEAALKATATSMNNNSWEAANINRLEDSGATKSEIIDKVSTISAGMQKYDLFLFHFSGHGSNGSDDNTQYLCAYEDGIWISVSDLSNALEVIPKPGTDSYITNVFVFLDACHSGNFIGRGMQGGFVAEVERTRVRKFRPFIPQREEVPSERRSLTFSRDLQDITNKDHLFVMTAVTGNESSWDDGGLQNGVFTYYLVEGIYVAGRYISAAPANTNNNTWLTGEEAFSYLDAKVNARVSPANGYPPDAVQDPQSQDNSTSTESRLIYNW